MCKKFHIFSYLEGNILVAFEVVSRGTFSRTQTALPAKLFHVEQFMQLSGGPARQDNPTTRFRNANGQLPIPAFCFSQ